MMDCHTKYLCQSDEAPIGERGDNKTLLAADELVLVDKGDVRDADHGPLLIRFEVKPRFTKSDQVFVSFQYLDCLSHSKSDAVLTLTRTNMSKMSLWCMCTVIKVSNFVLSIFVKFFTVCPISELRMSKNLLLVSPMI